MVTALLLAIALPAPGLRILFLGNSHTAMHDIPGMVRQLLETPSKKVTTKYISCGFLNDLDREDVRKVISDGGWDVVVMQAAKVSSSHKYTYSQQGGINLAKLAVAEGAKTLLFVEWPRRGWNESRLQMAVYERIAKKSGAKPVPICFAWDKAIKELPSVEFWAADGNHSALPGAYLAACTLSYYISGNANAWAPKGVDTRLAQRLRSIARGTWEGQRRGNGETGRRRRKT
jgi:hypothetical protein